MLETSCLDEAQKNKRGEWGVGAHLRWTLLRFKWRRLLARSTVAHSPLKLQLLILADPWILHHSRTTVQLLTLKSVEVQTEFAQTPCVGKVKLVLRTRCTDMVQSLNSMASLFWTFEWKECVCLGWTRDRPAASFFEQVLEQQPNTFGTSRMRVEEHSWISLEISFPVHGKLLTDIRFWLEDNYFTGQWYIMG